LRASSPDSYSDWLAMRSPSQSELDWLASWAVSSESAFDGAWRGCRLPQTEALNCARLKGGHRTHRTRTTFGFARAATT
jgi:hypothetical protein